MNKMQIDHGPFSGQSFTDADSYQRYQDDGTIRASIQMSKLTARFLEKFSPDLGWSVEITGEFVPVDMVPLPRADNPGASAQHVPTAKFVAVLKAPGNRVAGTASSLWTIQGPTDWEKGETNARQRLYEAMGLQSRFGDMPASADEVRNRTPVASVSKLHTVQDKPVSVTPLQEEEIKPKQEQSKAEVTQEKVKDEKVEKDEPAPAEPAKTDPKSEQSAMDLGDEDPLQLPPPAAMVQQIQRLAKLMQKEVPELATKQQALDFLAVLQGRGK